MVPVTTPTPVPSPQIGTPLVTYVLPPLGGKSHAVWMLKGTALAMARPLGKQGL